MSLARILRGFGLLALAALVLLSASEVRAGDLDSARQFWQVVNSQLGRDTILNVTDTMYSAYVQGAILSAVNSCIRKVAVHIGIIGHDTVSVTADSSFYHLRSDFIEDGILPRPFKVFGVLPGGQYFYGLRRGKPEEMGNLVSTAEYPTLWEITGGDFWINQATPDAEQIYISGPVEGQTMTAANGTTNVDEADRSAVCDCATALVGQSIGLSSASFYWDRFVNHALQRGGTVPAGGQ